MEDITFWQVFAAFWFATWYMSVFGTWKYIVYNLALRSPRHQMVERKYLHFLVYSTCINFLIPIVGLPLALSNDYRERWINAYVNALVKK